MVARDAPKRKGGRVLSAERILFARGRRTVTTWLRAVGIRDDFADYYYFLQPLGRKATG